jgi:hypothetical protein
MATTTRLHVDRALRADRDFGDHRREAAETVGDRHAAVHARRQRIAPARSLGHGLEDQPVLVAFLEQRQPVSDRIAVRGDRQFVDEAFAVERILLAGSAPEADRNMAVAHGVVDLLIRHRVGHVVERAHRRKINALLVERCRNAGP